MYKFQHDALI
jgi:hypothetical protein